MRKIGVVGLGLIGGSIALSLKANGFYVVGVETDADSLSFALKNNIIDSSARIDSLKGCESVFVCVPVSCTRETVEKSSPQRVTIRLSPTWLRLRGF